MARCKMFYLQHTESRYVNNQKIKVHLHNSYLNIRVRSSFRFHIISICYNLITICCYVAVTTHNYADCDNITNLIYDKYTFLSAALTIVLVLCIAWCVSRLTLADTLWCVTTLPTTGRSAAIHMVLTGGDGVGPAACRHKDIVSLL